MYKLCGCISTEGDVEWCTDCVFKTFECEKRLWKNDRVTLERHLGREAIHIGCSIKMLNSLRDKLPENGTSEIRSQFNSIVDLLRNAEIELMTLAEEFK